MKSIADQLPPDIARQLHPDRRKNEAEYWAARDRLLDQYRGQWIGFAAGRVIASGSSPVAVFQAAEASGRHPFFICVGTEDEPCRIRRVTGLDWIMMIRKRLPSLSRCWMRALIGRAGRFARPLLEEGGDREVGILGLQLPQADMPFPLDGWIAFRFMLS
jgi:hypothetical protein